ncbi:MAG: aminotransferase, partial [Candidatus Calescibacterium sp.]|nr:glycosyltransferase family 4 protein [Candidatus Calescibacterium sp.]MDW8195957.1 aminotransferase [Candidatus Calescibacterium sp.]
MYSKIKNKNVQNALLINYPEFAKYEKEIEQRVFWWSKHSDIVVTGLMRLDGFPRWDVCTPQFVVIDTNTWKTKKNYSKANGINEPVKVVHSPNHRGLKGTEFLIKTVEELKEEGLKIELILLEKVQNDIVREIMQEADILAEQFIIPGYGLNGIEGMASGLPVLANLDDPD